MDVWSSDEGCKSAEVGGDVGIFELLDGGHNDGGRKKGGTTMMEGHAKKGDVVASPSGWGCV